MSSGYQKIIMVGNLTREPELRYSSGGTAVCNMGIAVNSKLKYGDDEKEKDEVLFINVVVWGKQGESCSKYLAKGRQVLVEGRLQERKWESDGQQKSKMEIVASSVKFLGRKDDSGSYQGGTPPQENSGVEPF